MSSALTRILFCGVPLRKGAARVDGESSLGTKLMSAREPIPFRRRRLTEQDIVNAPDSYDDYGRSILDKFYAREAAARQRAALWRGIRNATVLLGMALALVAIGWALGFLH